jgi:hypothetical protein
MNIAKRIHHQPSRPGGGQVAVKFLQCNMKEEKMSTMEMIYNIAFLSKARVDAFLFKRENYYTKSDMIRGYRSLGDQYIGYIKDPVRTIEKRYLYCDVSGR